MIGYIRGRALVGDGTEVTLLTESGVGYRIKSSLAFSRGEVVEFYIAHIIKEGSQELFGFSSLRERDFFELLLSVKGVGVKGAYSLVTTLGVERVVTAIQLEDKKTLQRTQGIGAKVAAQILLDLGGKIEKMSQEKKEATFFPPSGDNREAGLLNEALSACLELGFSANQATLAAKKILNKHNKITESEQLVHLMLKEM